VERNWLASYERVLDEVLTGLTADKLSLAQELAELPDSVRGYGPVKERFLGHAEKRQAQCLSNGVMVRVSRFTMPARSPAKSPSLNW